MSRPDLIGAARALEVLTGEDRAGWAASPERDALAKTFRFADFNAAFGWMTRVALAAESLGHHPEWFNVYDRVEVVLTTHDADGVTGLDVRLAGLMEEFARAGQ